MYPIAIGVWSEGEYPPLVISPIVFSFLSKICVPSLAGSLPKGLMPTNFLSTPFSKSFLIDSWPIKPPFSILSFGIDHVKPASIGDTEDDMSFPYKQSPASILKEFLAPKPASLTPSHCKSSFINFSAYLSFIDISKPSSPVYPHLEIKNFSLL